MLRELSELPPTGIALITGACWGFLFGVAFALFVKAVFL